MPRCHMPRFLVQSVPLISSPLRSLRSSPQLRVRISPAPVPSPQSPVPLISPLHFRFSLFAFPLFALMPPVPSPLSPSPTLRLPSAFYKSHTSLRASKVAIRAHKPANQSRISHDSPRLFCIENHSPKPTSSPNPRHVCAHRRGLDQCVYRPASFRPKSESPAQSKASTVHQHEAKARWSNRRTRRQGFKTTRI
jgi:hypothetical protein